MNNRRKLIEKMVICLLGMCCALAWAAVPIVYPAICPGVDQPGACPVPTGAANLAGACTLTHLDPPNPLTGDPGTPTPPGCSEIVASGGVIQCWLAAPALVTVNCFECRRSLLCPLQGFEACVNLTVSSAKQQRKNCFTGAIVETVTVGPPPVQNGAKCDCGDNPVATPVDTPADPPVD